MRFLFVSTFIIALTITGYSCSQSETVSNTTVKCKNLPESAQKTYAAYIKAVKSGTSISSTNIPSSYWTAPIKALHPVKVYCHRVNIVCGAKHGQRNRERHLYLYSGFVVSAAVGR